MIRRWRAEAEQPEQGESAQLVKDKGVIEQRLSLVNNGLALILASDKVTRLFDLEGRELFLAKNFGTYFAVPNPQAANEVMLVMRSGAMGHLGLEETECLVFSSARVGLNDCQRYASARRVGSRWQELLLDIHLWRSGCLLPGMEPSWNWNGPATNWKASVTPSSSIKLFPARPRGSSRTRIST